MWIYIKKNFHFRKIFSLKFTQNFFLIFHSLKFTQTNVKLYTLHVLHLFKLNNFQ